MRFAFKSTISLPAVIKSVSFGKHIFPGEAIASVVEVLSGEGIG